MTASPDHASAPPAFDRHHHYSNIDPTTAYEGFSTVHEAEFQALATQPGDENLRTRFIEELHNLQEAVPDIERLFPRQYAYGMRQGMRELAADSAFALRAHLADNNETHVRLPLNKTADALPLDLSGDEPLRLLWKVTDLGSLAVRMSVYGVPISVVPVTAAKDYKLYRQLSGYEEVDYYMRPYGSPVYDQVIEYGRPGEGVEASYGVIFDTAQRIGDLTEVGKHRRTGLDTRISLRLDREGVAPEDRGSVGIKRNPIQQQGTLSLDIGSVLGHDDAIGTKIGRFLAYGNLLRNQALGTQGGLNHVTHYFSPKDGDADYFAVAVQDRITEMERNITSPDQLLARTAML